MAKYAWTWTIKEECVEEYVRMHRNPWPEMMWAHRAAGFRNYSIFQNGRQFFYYFECDDLQRARDLVAQDEACGRWNDICMGMMENSFGSGRVESGIEYLDEVFYLE